MTTPIVENTSHNNTSYYKDIIEKEDNKKETLLTTNFSIRTYLKEILDDFTTVNLLTAKPDLSIEKFKKLYEMTTLEFKGGFCNNINAYLVKAASGKWNFKHKTLSANTFNEEEAKINRVLKGKFNYYIDYFQIGSCSKDEILGKFLTEYQKYTDS